jgi:salicylate biosynthesis isochorismate synthase/menaquinone-specific isochorismate synthase
VAVITPRRRPGSAGALLAAVTRARKVGRPVLMGWTARWILLGPERGRVRVAAAGEDVFCFEQPDRDGRAGRARARCRGCRPPARIGSRVAADWRALTAGAVADAPDGPPGAGWSPSAASRSPRRRARAALGGLRRRDLIVPEVALARRGERRRAHAGRAGGAG